MRKIPNTLKSINNVVFASYGTWDVRVGCKILPQAVGVICPPGKPDSENFVLDVFRRNLHVHVFRRNDSFKMCSNQSALGKMTAQTVRSFHDFVKQLSLRWHLPLKTQFIRYPLFSL